MKKLVYFILLLVGLTYVVYPQSMISTGTGSWIERGVLLKTYTNWAGDAADTSGWFTSVDGIPIGAYREVAIIAKATDSVQASVYFCGGNSLFSSAGIKTGFTSGTQINISDIDSITTYGTAITNWSATNYYVKAFKIKDGTTNILAGCNRLRLIFDPLTAAQQGTTTGRKVEFWFFGVK